MDSEYDKTVYVVLKMSPKGQWLNPLVHKKSHFTSLQKYILW